MLHAHWPEQCLRAFGLCISRGWSKANFTQSLGPTTEGKEIRSREGNVPGAGHWLCGVEWGSVQVLRLLSRNIRGKEPRRHPPSITKAAGHTAGASQFPGFHSGDLESQKVYTFCR